ncbi:MAG: hypothetical protein H0W66_09275 [Chthoniobacterales bacterium]|nr:hypothetical protein [Chthoniobacterales bacterium]
MSSDTKKRIESEIVHVLFLGDPYGVLARSMATTTAAKAPETLTTYEAVLRFFLYQQRVSEEDHLLARLAIERAVKLQPGYADALAALSLRFIDEHRHAFNRQPNSADRHLARSGARHRRRSGQSTDALRPREPPPQKNIATGFRLL